MGIFDIFRKKEIKVPSRREEMNALFTGGTYKPLFHYTFDGEKNPGELGPLVEWELDYSSIRKRSWDSYLTSEITQTVVKRFVMWVIGKGLKLQSEPVESILKDEKTGANISHFIKQTEARFNLYLNSPRGDYTGKANLSTLAEIALTNAIVGGDVLVVNRVENGILNIQLVDGDHVRTPSFGNWIAEAKERGNRIDNGVEINSRGEHVAFYVQTDDDLKVKRVLAKGPKGKQPMAFLIVGFKYRINDERGIPLTVAILETLKKLDRYKEATVGSAEERAKIPYAIEHDQFSDGENPLLGQMTKAFNVGDEDSIPQDVNGKALQDKVAATVDKTVVNMPIGAKLKALDTKTDINFSGFYQPNKEDICATFGMPPEVAFMKYENNYSSSRAAIKDWEHTINVWRSRFSLQYYHPIFGFWLDLEIIKKKIQAPGYLLAMAQNNFDVLEAYRKARFVGASVPHIDPMKEVKAEREKLGSLGAHIPLTTAEAATERLDEGDFDSNLEKYKIELEKSEIEEKENPLENETENNE